MKREHAPLAILLFVSVLANAVLLMQVDTAKSRLEALKVVAHRDIESRSGFCRLLLEHGQELAAQNTLWSYDDLADARDGPAETCATEVFEHMKRAQARSAFLRAELTALTALVPGADADTCCENQSEELTYRKSLALAEWQKLDAKDKLRKDKNALPQAVPAPQR